MPKTRESIKAYNKEYFARPEVIARAKVRNAERRHVRAAYKKTEAGKVAELRYRQGTGKGTAEKNRIKHRYGITMEDYTSMLERQGNACAICGNSKGVRFHIDHDHVTNSVRGILCGQCNMALGLIKDSRDTLRKAIEYLDAV